MVFIRSGRVSGSPVLAFRAHRYKAMATALPSSGSAPLQPHEITSPAFRGFFFCPPLHVILMLCPPNSPSLCAPRFGSSPSSQRCCCGGDIAPLPPLHALPFAERAAPARQEPRYPRSNFTTKTSQCHLQREGGLLEQNARHFKPVRHLSDANPVVERERL